jgi:hypothetical protein
MSESDDKKTDDGNKDENKGGKKEPELSLESVKELVTNLKTEQAEAIESIKTESINNIAQLKQVVQDRDGDIQNLTNLLGKLADPDADNSDAEDLTVPENVQKLVNKTVAENKQAESDVTTKENKVYFKEYGTDIQELMNEKGPDGKPLSKEARDGIKELLIETVIGKTDNPTRDAHKNFDKARNIFFGLDRTHEFKGGDVNGTGGGGSDNKGPTKKVFKLTDEGKKGLTDLGETEEWGQEMLAKRAAEQAV